MRLALFKCIALLSVKLGQWFCFNYCYLMWFCYRTVWWSTPLVSGNRPGRSALLRTSWPSSLKGRVVEMTNPNSAGHMTASTAMGAQSASGWRKICWCTGEWWLVLYRYGFCYMPVCNCLKFCKIFIFERCFLTKRLCCLKFLWKPW